MRKNIGQLHDELFHRLKDNTNEEMMRSLKNNLTPFNIGLGVISTIRDWYDLKNLFMRKGIIKVGCYDRMKWYIDSVEYCQSLVAEVEKIEEQIRALNVPGPLVPCPQTPAPLPASLRLKYLDPNQTGDSDVDLSFRAADDVNATPKLIVTEYQHRPTAYRMLSKVRGFVLIINIRKFDDGGKYETRFYSEIDVRNFKSLFCKLSFKVQPEHVHEDLIGQEILDAVKTFATFEGHADADAMAVVVMSHGNAHGVLARDGLRVTERQLTEPFTGKNCPAMNGKPKLFFLACCRSIPSIPNQPRIVFQDGDPAHPPVTQPKIHNWSDAFFVWSTTFGEGSFRDEYGTWFCQEIINVFYKNSSQKSLQQLLNEVNHAMQKRCQAMQGLSWECSTRRDLYFNPGIYEET